jgi:hypothetical protein
MPLLRSRRAVRRAHTRAVVRIFQGSAVLLLAVVLAVVWRLIAR